MPSKVLPMMTSSEDSTMAASRALSSSDRFKKSLLFLVVIGPVHVLYTSRFFFCMPSAIERLLLSPAIPQRDTFLRGSRLRHWLPSPPGDQIEDEVLSLYPLVLNNFTQDFSSCKCIGALCVPQHCLYSSQTRH